MLKFSRLFGHESLKVRVLDRDLLVNRDLIQDFLACIDHPAPDKYGYHAPENISLKGDALRFCAHLSLIPLDRRERSTIVKDLERISAEQYPDEDIAILDPAHRLLIRQLYADQNMRISREFLGSYDDSSIQRYFFNNERYLPTTAASEASLTRSAAEYDIYNKLNLGREKKLDMFAKLSSDARSLIVKRSLEGSDYDEQRALVYVDLPELEKNSFSYEWRLLECNNVLLQRHLNDFQAWRTQRDCPKSLEEYKGHNIVEWRERLYAVPHGVAVDWQGGPMPPDPNIRVAVDLRTLRSAIDGGR
jgi:hypothetical protein